MAAFVGCSFRIWSKSVVKPQKRKALTSVKTLNFEGVGDFWESPPSVMNEIRICLPYMYYTIKEMCLKYDALLKEF